MYSIKIGLKFGDMTVSCNTYREAMNKYEEIKKEYSNIPCTITVCKEDQIQFVKNNKNSFDNFLYKLLDTLEEIGKYQIDMSEAENEYHQLKNKMYHDLEEVNLEGLSDNEQLDILHNMKNNLTKRRLIENENAKNYGFYSTYNTILDSLDRYFHSHKKTKERQGQNRFNNNYYKESAKIKKDKLDKINNLRELI